MSILNVNFTNNRELEAVAPGEYKLKLVSIREGQDKNGNPYIMPLFELVDEPYAKSVSHFLGLPYPGMDPKQENNSNLKLQYFLQALGWDSTEGDVDLNTLLYRECWAILDHKEDPTYGGQNNIKRFLNNK